MCSSLDDPTLHDGGLRRLAMTEQRDRAVAALAEAITSLAHGRCCWDAAEDADAILTALTPEAAAAIRAYLGAERDDIGEYRRAAHRGNPDQPIDIETLAERLTRAIHAASNLYGSYDWDWVLDPDVIKAIAARLRNESQP